jgi:hypothetical protein
MSDTPMDNTDASARYGSELPVSPDPATKAGRIHAALARAADPGGTALDFAAGYVAAGGFLKDLATELTAAMGEPVRRDALVRIVYALPGAHDRMADARKAGGDALVEDAVGIIDDAPTDNREELTKAVKRAETRQWIAERSNPANWGGLKQTTVNVLSIGALHLDSLRRLSPRGNETPPALPAGPDSGEVVPE